MSKETRLRMAGGFINKGGKCSETEGVKWTLIGKLDLQNAIHKIYLRLESRV